MDSPSLVIPALFTRISIRPNLSSTALPHALIDPSSPTSSANTSAVPPAARISSATAPSLSTPRAASATVAPIRPNSSAHARPIPCDAPVTSATRPIPMLINPQFLKRPHYRNSPPPTLRPLPGAHAILISHV